MGFGLALVVLFQQSAGLKILLGGIEIAGHDFQLADGVEQGRHFLAVAFRQRPVTRHQLLHQLSFIVVADGEAVAGTQFAPLKLVLLQ